MSKKTEILKPDLRLIAWEITRSCNLNCIHCRAAAERGPYQGELATEECFRFIDEVAAFSRPVLILTGGEPLLREDIFEIASYSTRKGLRAVMAVNGTLLTAEKARAAKQAGIQRVSISLDGAAAESHDRFRGVSGAFAGAMEGISYLKEAGLAFQINTTVTKRNLTEIESILQLAIQLGATAHHIFLLVPTGRGKELAGEDVLPEAYERTLVWFAEQEDKAPLQLKATCAPQYYRIIHQHGDAKDRKGQGEGLHTFTRGCLGGISFCFLSHQGDVQPCGYLEIIGGNIKERPFQEIWEKAEVFQRLRDINLLKGKCGQCEYRAVCGGCRARAYALHGDYLEEEPLCPYEPLHHQRAKRVKEQLSK
ncbi:MAG: heme b synthase [Deltaproteobacteria bacterium RBG_16_54_11]|nr:MAG: heme b synthase [Deltaproteobacteria bacterium RBG_16_54_11]